MIDFSQSLTQILASMGQNFNTNPKEDFNVISACNDTWKETMTAWQKKQGDKISGLEQQIHIMKGAFQESQQAIGRLQDDFFKLDEMVSRHELVIPKLREEVGTTLMKVNSVLAVVDRKIEEFQEWINNVKPMDMTTEIHMEIVNSLNEIILNNSPSTTMESVCQ